MCINYTFLLFYNYIFLKEFEIESVEVKYFKLFNLNIFKLWIYNNDNSKKQK